MRTQADKEQELSERKLRINMHYKQVIDRAPELVFFKSRMETEKLGNRFLKSMYVNMCLRPLTDLQVESAQKAYETLLASKLEYKGIAPAPDGITHIQGYIQETMRVKSQISNHLNPNRPVLVIREDRGFIVRLSCPVAWISQAGSLNKLTGRRIACTVDLMPTTEDHTVAIRRPNRDGGIGGSFKNMQLFGNQFDDLEMRQDV